MARKEFLGREEEASTTGMKKMKNESKVDWYKKEREKERQKERKTKRVANQWVSESFDD